MNLVLTTPILFEQGTVAWAGGVGIGVNTNVLVVRLEGLMSYDMESNEVSWPLVLTMGFQW